MKHTLLLLACICAAKLAQSQITAGKITYEESMTMAAPDDLPADAGFLRDIFAKGMHFTRVLSFNQDATVFRAEKKDERKAAGSTDDGMQVQFNFSAPEEITYTDLKTGSTIEQRDLMGKKFLVSGETQRRKWQMTGKQKTVLNYPCQEAVSYGKDTLLAWFTTAIPVSAGPPDWRGLPGMVLEGSRVLTGGSYSIKASKVEEGPVALAAPKEGKKVTKAEFEKIEKEKQKEIEEQFGGGHGNGHMIIRMER